MGKIEKHTEYYCDICGDRLSHAAFSKSWYGPSEVHADDYGVRGYYGSAVLAERTTNETLSVL